MRRPANWRALGLLRALASAAAVTAAGDELPPVPRDAVTPLAAPVARSDVADVTLGPGPFRDAMERNRLRQAEVEDLHHAVRRDLDIRRLQIPVNDALLVGGVERLGDLPCERAHFGER